MDKFKVNVMDLRDGSWNTVEVPTKSTLFLLYSRVHRPKYPEYDRSKAKFFLMKHDDGSWLDKDSDEARALRFDHQVRPPLRAMLERPSMERWMLLDDPRLLGKDFVFNEKDIHIMVLLPFKHRLDRWAEKLKRLPCGTF